MGSNYLASAGNVVDTGQEPPPGRGSSSCKVRNDNQGQGVSAGDGEKWTDARSLWRQSCQDLLI